MTAAINLILNNFDYSLLLFLRVSGLILPSPIFGRKTLPNIIKIVFCIFMSFFFLNVFPPTGEGVGAATTVGYVLLCFKELLFGFSMGYITTVFFNLAFSAGQMIDMQIGFGIVSVYDVQNNSQLPVTGNLLNIILLIVFFVEKGHLKLISILGATLDKVPIGHVMLSTDFINAILEAFCLSFVLACMVAMPILAAGLMLEIAMGVLIRSVPQMNMFVIGIPIKTLVGLIVLIFTLPVFIKFSSTIFTEMFQAVQNTFGTFGVLQ